MELIDLVKKDVQRSRCGFFKAYFNSNVRAVISYRINSYIYRSLSTKLAYILHNIDRKKYNVDIYPASKIGKGFILAHLGAVVIGDGAVLGDNCTVQSGVTIGQKNSFSGFPIIGNNVYIGSGAKVLGDIVIGDNTIIGANSVVTTSFDSNSVIGGVPAKYINRE
ncbi:serine O-acetyltransferase [Shewanella basaltis]|uniref:serine O-acetyltransferase n=1 Tax=Shewanella basaltis TaxID=472183 RepID=UPI003AACCAED